jgi:hypothetical protein
VDSDQVVRYRLGAAFGKLLIVFGRTDRVGVAGDDDFLDIVAQQWAVGIQGGDDSVDFRLERRRQLGAVKRELHIADDHSDQLDLALGENLVAAFDRRVSNHGEFFLATDFFGDHFFGFDNLVTALFQVFVGIRLSGAHAAARGRLDDLLAARAFGVNRNGLCGGSREADCAPQHHTVTEENKSIRCHLYFLFSCFLKSRRSRFGRGPGAGAVHCVARKAREVRSVASLARAIHTPALPEAAGQGKSLAHVNRSRF